MRRGVRILASSPAGKQIIYESKRAAAREIGCSDMRIAAVIKLDMPVRIAGDYYWLDYLFECEDVG